MYINECLTDVFEGFLQLGQRGQTGFNHRVGPVVDLGVDVAVTADCIFDGLFDDVGHLVHDKLGLRIALSCLSRNISPV